MKPTYINLITERPIAFTASRDAVNEMGINSHSITVPCARVSYEKDALLAGYITVWSELSFRIDGKIEDPVGLIRGAHTTDSVQLSINPLDYFEHDGQWVTIYNENLPEAEVQVSTRENLIKVLGLLNELEDAGVKGGFSHFADVLGEILELKARGED